MQFPSRQCMKALPRPPVPIYTQPEWLRNPLAGTRTCMSRRSIPAHAGEPEAMDRGVTVPASIPAHSGEPACPWLTCWPGQV